MKKPVVASDWPASWRTAYAFDCMEFFGEDARAPGYVCAYRTRFNKLIEAVEAHVPRGGRIIDVAAAQGNFSLALAERGYAVTWNDLREELAGYVQLKHESGDITYRGGDAFGLDIGGFDAVVITEIIEHVAHPDKFLAQVATLVRPGGYVFMTTPNGGYIRNRLPRFSTFADPSVFEAVQFKPDADGHIFLLHADEIPSLADAAGLEIKDLQLFTNPLTAGHVKLSLLHKVMPQAAIMRLERASQSALPADVARRLLTQLGVCFQKPRAAA